MTSEEIIAAWQQDTIIDMTELAAESTSVPRLHGKYLGWLVNAQNDERAARKNLQKMTKIKSEYYMGTLDKRTLDHFGWPPFLRKIIKTELPTYLEADEDLQELKLKHDTELAKCKHLEEIIRSLNFRGNLIKNAIEWVKFQNGVN